MQKYITKLSTNIKLEKIISTACMSDKCLVRLSVMRSQRPLEGK